MRVLEVAAACHPRRRSIRQLDAIRFGHVRRVVCSGLMRDFLFFIDMQSRAGQIFPADQLDLELLLEWNSLVLAHCTLYSSTCAFRFNARVQDLRARDEAEVGLH
jgi:hypothetical protein